MPPLKTTRHSWEIWRFQCDRINPDVVTGMTKDRKRFCFVTAKSDPAAHALWVRRFKGRITIYVKAIVGPSEHKPTIQVLEEVETW